VRRLAGLTLFVLGALAAVGCGESGGPGETAEIEEAIVASNSNDPADCRRFQTLRMLEQSTKLRGRAAVASCERVALEEWPLATSVTVTKVEVDGSEATAHAAFEGSANDGQTFEVALVKRVEGWKLDQILAFVVFSPEKLVLEWGRQMLTRAATAAERDTSICVLHRLEQMSDAELEALVLESTLEPFLRLMGSCESPSASA
jgi:hypothetical protein